MDEDYVYIHISSTSSFLSSRIWIMWACSYFCRCASVSYQRHNHQMAGFVESEEMLTGVIKSQRNSPKWINGKIKWIWGIKYDYFINAILLLATPPAKSFVVLSLSTIDPHTGGFSRTHSALAIRLASLRPLFSDWSARQDIRLFRSYVAYSILFLIGCRKTKLPHPCFEGLGRGQTWV